MKKFLLALAFSLVSVLGFAQSISPQLTVIPSTTQTTTVTSADIANPKTYQQAQWNGAHVIVNVSSYVTGTFTVTIQGKDPVSGAYYNLLTSAGIAAAGTTVLKIYPGIAVASNVSASDLLPAIWRVNLVGSASPAPKMKLSVGAFLFP